MDSKQERAFKAELDAYSDKLAKEINTILFKKAEEYIKQLAQEAVKEFHAAHTYVPNGYKPTGAISSFVHSYVNDEKFLIDSSSKYGAGDWRADADYLYSVVFLQGYHGGADAGRLHPSIGTPYYRTPMPESKALQEINEERIETGKKPYPPYYRWGAKADQSTPPFVILKQKIIDFDKGEWQEIKTKIMNEVSLKHINELKQIISKYPEVEYKLRIVYREK